MSQRSPLVIGMLVLSVPMLFIYGSKLEFLISTIHILLF